MAISSRGVDENRTTIAVQRYLEELACAGEGTEAERVVRALLARAVNRLHALCAGLLCRKYPRLTRGPLNLCPEEMLSAVVERLIKAMRNVRPLTVRQFFALANQHMRWELNDLARRLDGRELATELHDSHMPTAAAPCSQVDTGTAAAPVPSPELDRILAAIDGLPEEEREVFNLLRVQGMTKPEAARIVGVSTKTVQRREIRAIVMLNGALADLNPARKPPTSES